jgi:hypothetical protein
MATYTFVALSLLNISRFRYFDFMRLPTTSQSYATTWSSISSFWGRFIGFFDVDEIFTKTNEFQNLVLVGALFYIYITVLNS